MSYSNKQLRVIRDFGTDKNKRFVLHSGPFGCGKTYSLVVAFGLYCLKLSQAGVRGLNFVLLGKTQQSVKKNMCNVLAKLFGADFRYDGSKKDGVVKDATLFGQVLYIIGLNDTSSETKFRGISDIMGILHDEAVLCSQDQFDYIMGRLRGEHNNLVPDQFVQQWYVGSTNPDAPTHFLLDYIKKNILRVEQWSIEDAAWDGCEEYYRRLKLLYKDNPSFYARYLLGKWVAADRMVYSMFNPKKHVVDSNETYIEYKNMRRNFISIDYGSDHPTAVLLISINHQGIYIISKEYKFRNTAPSDIVQHVGLMVQFLIDSGSYCSSIYVDPSAVAIKDELVKHKLDYRNALNEHQAGIGFIQTLMALGRLLILDCCENLIGEIYTYKYKDNNSGKDEVVKLDDDFCDSMRYGCYTDSVLAGF